MNNFVGDSFSFAVNVLSFSVRCEAFYKYFKVSQALYSTGALRNRDIVLKVEFLLLTFLTRVFTQSWPNLLILRRA